jgi:hypothetical protein
MSKLTKLIFSPNKFFKDMNAKKTTLATAVSLNVSPIVPTIIHPKGWKQYRVVLHTGEGLVQGRSHLDLWINDFIKSDVSFAVVVRNMDLYAWFKSKYPDIGLAYAKTPIGIESLLNSRCFAFLRGIFYMSNTGNNIHCLRFNQYKHIFIGHGDSDKSASAHKFFRAYDEIWVAGQAHIDRFANSNFESRHLKFVTIGRPNLYSVVKKRSLPWNVQLINKVLYLPTWEGAYEDSNYSSLRFAPQLLLEIMKRLAIQTAVKMHPATGTRDKSLLGLDSQLQDEIVQSGYSVEIMSKSTTISECILNANIYICDISAVVSECLTANGPIFVYIPSNTVLNVTRSNMEYKDFCYTYSSIDELLEKLEQILQGKDPLSEFREQALEYFLSKSRMLENAFKSELYAVANTDSSKHNLILNTELEKI